MWADFAQSRADFDRSWAGRRNETHLGTLSEQRRAVFVIPESIESFMMWSRLGS